MASWKRKVDDADSENQSNDGSSSSSDESEVDSANSDAGGEAERDVDDEDKEEEESDEDEEMNEEQVKVKGESDSDNERTGVASDADGSDAEMEAPIADEDDDSEEKSGEEEEKDDDKDDEKEEDRDDDMDEEKDPDKEEEVDKEKEISDNEDSDSDDDREIAHAADADDVLADLNLDDDDDEDEHKDAIGGDEREEEEPPEEIPITRIEVEIPKIPTELGNDIHFVKLPNFLSVDTHPYDPSWYEDEIDEDEILDEEGRHRLKLKVESTIRWRTVADESGESRRESNARIVKWSDGSMSLHLGSEIFDIHKQSLMVGDNNHLFIRQGTGLQGQAVFKTKLTFRPHSTDSFTHRKMTLSLAERSHKTQKIRVLPNVGKDPEAHRSEMIKKEEDKLKASIRRENKMRRVREKAPFRGPTASYLEPDAYDDDDDDGGVSLSAIKKRYKKGGAGYNIYTDSDESDDIEKKKASTDRKRTAKVVESDDDDDE